MNKVLVTGGGGFIGSTLTRELLRRGCVVTVVGRNSYPELAKLGVRCEQGDIRDLACLTRLFRGQDTVFHVAAKAGIWGAWSEYQAINVLGTEQVIAACQHNAVPRLVYTSTPSVVFDQYDLAGSDETLPYAQRPLCHYAASKILAEQAVLAANSANLATIAIRPHLVWGPGDQQLIPRLLARGRAGSLKIVGSGRNQVDIAYIDNVVHAHILAAEHLVQGGVGAGQAFFIGQEEPVVLWDWVNTLFARLDIPAIRRKVPFAVAYGLGWGLELAYRVLGKTAEPKMTRFLAHQLGTSHWYSHDKAKRLLGYRELVTTEAGMERLVAWVGGGGDN